jgi:hypothetical protein
MYAGWTTNGTTYSYTTTPPSATSVAKPATLIGTRTVQYNANGGNSTPMGDISEQYRTFTWDGKWWTTSGGGTQVTSSS